MKNYLAIVFIFLTLSTYSQSESEPNNNFASGNRITENTSISGTLNSSTDVSDYFKTFIDEDGTVVLYLTATNTSGNSGFIYLYCYDARVSGGNFFSAYVGGISNIGSGITVRDTIRLYGRAADSMYFRFDASANFNYSLNYSILDKSTNDFEPNNTIFQSLSIDEKQSKSGHINYVSKGVGDDPDYYKSKLPTNGTLRIYMEGTNMSNLNGYLYLYAYDGRGNAGNVLNRYISGSSSVKAGVTVFDTMDLYGRAIDSFFFRVHSSGAFKYTIRYEMIDTGDSDIEPNNLISLALPIEHKETKSGQIGYLSKGSSDEFDTYATKLPSNGTIKVFVEGLNVGGSNGYLYMYVYDGRGNSGNILAKYISGSSSVKPGIAIFDTSFLYGKSIDSIYFKLSSSSPFKYKIRYEMVDTGDSDIEPNNTIQLALPIEHKQTKSGQISYMAKGSTDEYDTYATKLPSNGTIKVYVEGLNVGGTSGYLYMYLYDGRGNSGNILAKYISGSSSIKPGVAIFDTTYLYGRSIDSVFFKMSSSSPFKYKIRYEMLDTGDSDIEPNNILSLALPIQHQQTKSGQIGYLAKGSTDEFDSYSTKLPVDGTMKIYVEGVNVSGSNGYLYLYGYDGRGNAGNILSKYITGISSIKPRVTIYDTIYLYGRAVDSMFLKFTSSTAFKYKLRYEMLDTGNNDKEPNNLIAQAIQLKHKEVKRGNIGFISKGGSDESDYYTTKLPSDGTMKIFVEGLNASGKNSYLYMYVYDGRGNSGNIMSKYVSGSSSIKPDSLIFDTIYLHGRGIDSIFIKMTSSGPFKYKIHYEMIDTSLNDIEPNNSFNTPLSAPIGVRKVGHIGYVAAGKVDDDDYYKTVLPIKGSVRLITEVRNTGAGNGYVYIYGYDKRKGSGNVLGRYIKGISSLKPGVVYRDTILVNCFNSDTFYLRWTSSGSFQYSCLTEFIDRKPIASTENERIGNTVGFRPQLSNADKFIWDFGDATTSTLKYPMKTFKIGVYTTRLIVTNSFCNYKDTSTEIIEVKGVEYYTPDSSGTGGDAIMKIYGGGLDTSTIVYLRKGGVKIYPIAKTSNINNSQLELVFDLHLVDEGYYDVLITVPGQSEVVYTDGFRVGKFRYPQTWSEVVAPSRWRINVDNKFKLLIGNSGNVMASGTIVTLIWPKSVDLKFDTKWFAPPKTGNYSIVAGDTTFNFKWENIARFYSDTFNTITSIDTFNGKPYNGYMRVIMIPRIAAGGTFVIPLIARTSTASAQNFITYTTKTNLFGSCQNGTWMDASENMAVEFVDLLDKGISASPALEKSPVGWLTKATKGTTKHMANLGQAMGAFWNYATGVTESIDASLPADYYANVDAGNAQVAQAILEVGVDKLVEGGADRIMKGQTDRLNDWMVKNPNASMNSFEFAIDNLNDINDIRNAVKDMYKNAKDLKDLNEKLARLDALLKDCPELKKQVDDLKKELGKDMHLRDPKETKTNSVTSMDPNEIYGPVGQGDNDAYLNRIFRQSFLVTFENIDTAQASAQIVTVIDTLDKTKFDLSTFEFTDYFIGKRFFSVPAGRKEFVFEDSLSPLMRVRVNAQLDEAKGIVTWQFTAIDPATGDIPVFEGFLPPNVLKPEGEGGVSYTVQPWPTLQDGDVITNRASIIFDSNDPIITNTWVNIIDIKAPSSSVSAVKSQSPGVIHLTFSGNDASSGVGYYNLYVKQNNGEWLPFGGSVLDTLTVTVEYGHKYSFCAIAVDKVGNVESKVLTEETTVSIDKVENKIQELVLRPNPAGTTVSIDGLNKDAIYTITDITGRVIQSGTLQQIGNSIDVSLLKTGIYIITVTGSSTQSLKLIKI